MKTILLTLFFLVSSFSFSQTKYEKGMQKAMKLWEQNKLTEAANMFERIAKAEKENWLPPYYAGYVIALSSFGEKEEATLKAKLDKAELLLGEASILSPNNPEILIAKALHNTAYIAFDGQKYGMTMSGKNTALYSKALKLAPKNPRVILAKAEWDMGSAEFFGQSIEPYCKDVEKALSLFDTEAKNDMAFYPNWGKDRAKEVLKKCKKIKNAN